MDDNDATIQLLQMGRLSQKCPACGLEEAAGYSCTNCYSSTGPKDWVKQAREMTPEHKAALVAGRRKSLTKGSLPSA